MSEVRYELADRFVGEGRTVFLSGTQALARLPIEQLRADRRDGRRTAAFVSGYPGSPLGGFDVTVRQAARLATDLDIECRPAVNEEYAATAVMGSQLAATFPSCRYEGIVGIWYGKAPGVDRATDALRHAVYTGTAPRGGVVAFVGDDPNAKSSTLPSSSAGLLHDLHVPMLYPADPSEVLDLGLHAVALSRASGLWTALKVVADVADGTATVDLAADRAHPTIPELALLRPPRPPNGHLLGARSVDVEREIYEVRYPIATAYAAVNSLNEVIVDAAQPWIGIVASGITYHEVREALHRLGLRDDDAIASLGIRLLRLQMPFPFDPATVRTFASGLDEVLVIEEKQPTIEALVKDALYSVPDRPRIVGKLDEQERALIRGYGSLVADDLMPALRQRLARVADHLAPERPARERIAVTDVTRTPFFCSGCPHNRSAATVPDGALVGAGIGCHTMALLMEPEQVGEIAAITCMGNEGTQWIGIAPFIERTDLIQNLGDGTYFHSGQLAVTAAVAAGIDVTYKLLYNGTVAMTGGQHPEGQRSVASVAATLLAQGVAKVLITTDDVAAYRRVRLPAGVDVWHRDRLLEAQEHLVSIPGVTVLIHDQACAAELRRARKRGRVSTPTHRVAINHRVCEGCGDCGRVSNCLSVQPVETPFGRATTIDQTTCNLDLSCLGGDCPSFVTIDTRPPRWRRRRADDGVAEREALSRAAALAGILDGDLPEPQRGARTDDTMIRMIGVGGTGVVTVAQVLGTAAMLDGYRIRGLDQTGLSQKAGPVVSDLHLTWGHDADSSRIGAGQADALLVFDVLAAASRDGIGPADPARTAVVGSTSIAPPGRSVTHPDAHLPSFEELDAVLRPVTSPEHRHWVDADRLTREMFGDTVTANMLVAGMAVQAGAVPVDPERIEEAIALNGVMVDANTAAFRLGRHVVADPGVVDRLVPADDPETAVVLPLELRARVAALDVEGAAREVVERLTAELVAYQDEPYASEYLAFVERTCRIERELAPRSGALTRAVAQHLYRLMAYKDEYEVARLLLDPDARTQIDAIAQGRVRYHLHPPVLRSMGLRRKIRFSEAADPVLRLLARGKRLRGTRFDPFGWPELRRVERSLPAEYRTAMERVFAHLDSTSLSAAVAIASLPDMVRGYEDIKLRAVEEFRAALDAAVHDLVDT